MTYATRQDMVARFGAAELDKLDPVEDPDAETPVYPHSPAALADASAEIDARLAVAYDLSALTGSYPALTAAACDLARLRLYDNAPTDAVTALAAGARETLGQLAAGDIVLVDSERRRVARLAQAEVRSRGREFTGSEFDDRIGGLDQF